MKTELTIAESAKLIELGVDPKLASHYEGGEEWNDEKGIYDYSVPSPIFTLTDILKILPKEIGIWPLEIGTEEEVWYARYSGIKFREPCFYAAELIDALYQLLIYCIKEGHYNPKSETK